MNMNQHDKVLLDAIWHMIGIAPIQTNTGKTDINIILSTLPPEEARVMKRKFRKMWRNLVKKRLARPKVNKAAVMQTFGLHPQKDESAIPTKSQKINRKRIVMQHVVDNVLTSMKKSARTD